MSPNIQLEETIEVRCVKIDGINNDVQTWPDICQISFNDNPLLTLAPLANNIGLKKRRD
jgi:hypothetical protein